MKELGQILILVTCFSLSPVEARAEISVKQVESALRQALAHVTAETSLAPGTLRFPSVVMREPGQIAVERIAVEHSGHVDALLRCHPTRACMPFHASAELEGKTTALTWSAHQPPDGARRVRHAETQLRRGERVVFVREHTGVRTQMLAIALDGGAVGDVVRVRAVDGKHEVMRGRLGANRMVKSES